MAVFNNHCTNSCKFNSLSSWAAGTGLPAPASVHNRLAASAHLLGTESCGGRESEEDHWVCRIKGTGNLTLLCSLTFSKYVCFHLFPSPITPMDLCFQVRILRGSLGATRISLLRLFPLQALKWRLLLLC